MKKLITIEKEKKQSFCSHLFVVGIKLEVTIFFTTKFKN